MSWVVSLIVAAALAAFFAPAASARDDAVTSFDGTRIVLSFFPAEGLQPGEKAPTILIGPGWSSGRDTDENGASSDLFGSTGVGPFRRAGYNVLTWDPRGFGESGGTVQVDSPAVRGPRRAGPDRLRRRPARGAARRRGRPARRACPAPATAAASSSSRPRSTRASTRSCPTSPGTRSSRASTRTAVAEGRMGLGAVRARRRADDPGDSRR